MHITKIINESGDITSNLIEIRILWITVHLQIRTSKWNGQKHKSD